MTYKYLRDNIQKRRDIRSIKKTFSPDHTNIIHWKSHFLITLKYREIFVLFRNKELKEY